MIWISGWNDNAVTHGWVQDHRSYLRPLLAELTILQHEFIVNLGLTEGDSMLCEVFNKTFDI